MKITEDVTIPARIEKREKEILCDSCGTTVKDPGGYRILDITIERAEGTNYPGDYDVEREIYDCCPACWVKIEGLFKTGPRPS
jgi:hypothetical protein